jgi:hypothetical protein
VSSSRHHRGGRHGQHQLLQDHPPKIRNDSAA